MAITVHARIETVPPSHHAKAPDRETRALTATAETYPEALAEVRSQVPDGWRLMLVDVER